MEEVDNIIIDSLRNLSCNIDEDVQSLKQFTTEIVYSSMVFCLQAINPDIHFVHSLPQSMSLRLKNATTIAEHIKELGYRGDMGYQTILYCNEIEIRRVLMFLVERLPREVHKSTVSTELGYVPKLVKKIDESVRLNLEKPWVPSEFLKFGSRDCKKMVLKQDFGYGHNLQSEIIQIPDLQKQDCVESLKQYWVHYLPEVTKQCLKQNVVPSLLYRDSEFTDLAFSTKVENVETNSLVNNIEISNANLVKHNGTTVPELSIFEIEINKIRCAIEENKHKYEELQISYNNLDKQLAQITDERHKKEAALKESLTKIKTRSKTLAVLQNKENLIKLKNLVDNGNKRLVELANHWNDIQSPLLQEYQELQEQLKTRKSKIRDEEQKLQNLKDKKISLKKELSEKEKLEQQLATEYEKLNKNTNRSAYTRRILEIIANIKKQSEEIQKILIDTKIVQKDINSLNGQLDRSFTLSDELIFRDAKRDAMARSAYKLLATLHKDCGEVVQAVTTVGLVERESRNLQEQIDAELCKEVTSKLERLNNDIIEMKRENALLINKLTERTC
ncbi:hypothetical protein RN001_002674 [Aquatica leii]|uniref:Coiled-coil domain-containing protein 22 homolog n=1 Tax=Aquatica leii TaxID=1421715 RepID=A0AAN7PHI6_9COLE|nr:hypothetical protein RN001_002674 [Aquatica leii]